MGTSRSVPSPNTTPWRSVVAAYASPIYSPERIAILVWRATASEPECDLIKLLSDPITAECQRVAMNHDDLFAAAEAVALHASQEKISGIAVDLSRRAIVMSGSQEDRTKSFVKALFVEATNYIVSRDIYSHLGGSERLATISKINALKDSILNAVERTVNRFDTTNAEQSPESWRTLVEEVGKRLRND